MHFKQNFWTSPTDLKGEKFRLAGPFKIAHEGAAISLYFCCKIKELLTYLIIGGLELDRVDLKIRLELI